MRRLILWLLSPCDKEHLKSAIHKAVGQGVRAYHKEHPKIENPRALTNQVTGIVFGQLACRGYGLADAATKARITGLESELNDVRRRLHRMAEAHKKLAVAAGKAPESILTKETQPSHAAPKI